MGVSGIGKRLSVFVLFGGCCLLCNLSVFVLFVGCCLLCSLSVFVLFVGCCLLCSWRLMFVIGIFGARKPSQF